MTRTRTVLLAVSLSLALGGSMGLAQAQPTETLKAQVGASSKWAGHQPGKLRLGMSCGTVCPQKAKALGESYGVHRQFNGWGNWSGLGQDIRSDHAANRLPWVSIKPPMNGAAGWRAIAQGKYDAELRGLARTLKANDKKPVLLTFHHEPSNDGTEAQGVLWARAYVHLHDLLKANGALRNVSDPPIMGDWVFNSSNKTQNPANWLTRGVLKRAPFLGIDLYENSSGGTFAQRIPVVLRWLAAHGFPNKMVGIGETGSTDSAYGGKSAVRWMKQSLAWAARNTDKVGVVSYFNSSANSRSGVYWPLDESPAKMKAFRGFLHNPRVIS